jgi:hypothetical protein
MGQELSSGFKEIFTSFAFLEEANKKGCLCALISNNEKWLNQGGVAAEGTYVILVVLDAHQDLLYADGEQRRYSSLLRDCLPKDHRDNVETGEVMFS